jgi:Uma2 family endonuclease
MSIAEKPRSAGADGPQVSVTDYLADELSGRVKHEYVGGAVYMMSGARNAHNIIAGNVFLSLGLRLKGRPFRPFNSDTKIRIRLPTQIRFYYPDVSVIGRQNGPMESFQDEPVVVVEVLSRSTRRIDDGEKKEAYLTIPSLAVYLLVEQESAAIVAYRRNEQGFVREAYSGLEAAVPLPEIEATLPLSEVYESVQFMAETEPDE